MRHLATACAVAALALAAANAQAQVIDKKGLSLDGARAAISAAKSEALRRGTTGAFAVVDEGGNLVAVERIDGTFSAGARISTGKARTAALFQRPTKVFEEIIRKGRTPMVALEDFTPLQGGVPIVVDGHTVGAIGVSGAASADEDEELAQIGARALAAPSVAAAGADPTRFFDRDAVAAAFAKGAVIFDGSGGANYEVHASRRERPGLAEVHETDTDVIHVLGGTATFVTGGEVVEPRTEAPKEVRGRSILGGTMRRLSKGDVVIVPRGVPHWFREVDAPFTYYVVKVR